MSEKVKEAALWLAIQEPKLDGPIVPILKERFSLTAYEATQAIVEANLIRARAL